MDVEINKIISQLNKLKKTARIRCIKPVFLRSKRTKTRKSNPIKVKSKMNKMSNNWSTISKSNTNSSKNSTKSYEAMNMKNANSQSLSPNETNPLLSPNANANKYNQLPSKSNSNIGTGNNTVSDVNNSGSKNVPDLGTDDTTSTTSDEEEPKYEPLP